MKTTSFSSNISPNLVGRKNETLENDMTYRNVYSYVQKGPVRNDTALKFQGSAVYFDVTS